MGFTLVVERVRQRPCELSGGCDIRKWGALRQRSRYVPEIGDHLEIGCCVWRPYADGEETVCGRADHLCPPVAVVGEQIPPRHHRCEIGIASQDLEAAELLAVGRLQAREDPVACQEEV